MSANLTNPTAPTKTHAFPRSRPKSFLSHPRALAQSQYGRHCLYDPQRLSTHPKKPKNDMNHGNRLGQDYFEDEDRIRMWRKEKYERPTTAGREEIDELVASGWSEGTWLAERTNGTTTLSLENFKLTKVPRDICGMTFLVSLSLSNNGIASIPRAIGNLTQLTSLDVSFNLLTTIPIEIGQSTLGSAATTQFAVGGLLRMTKLKLNNNKITVLPQSLSRLVDIVDIDLENNHLTELPAGVGKWKNVER